MSSVLFFCSVSAGSDGWLNAATIIESRPVSYGVRPLCPARSGNNASAGVFLCHFKAPGPLAGGFVVFGNCANVCLPPSPLHFGRNRAGKARHLKHSGSAHPRRSAGKLAVRCLTQALLGFARPAWSPDVLRELARLRSAHHFRASVNAEVLLYLGIALLLMYRKDRRQSLHRTCCHGLQAIPAPGSNELTSVTLA